MAAAPLVTGGSIELSTMLKNTGDVDKKNFPIYHREPHTTLLRCQVPDFPSNRSRYYEPKVMPPRSR